MNVMPRTIDSTTPGVVVLDRSEDLAAFEATGIAAAIWQRQLAADFLNWMEALPSDRLPRARTVVRTTIIRNAVRAICESNSVPDCSFREFLIEDVALLCERFSDLMKSQFLQVRFDVVQDNACRKFHVDAVTARLVCTYRGLGTQYGTSTDGEVPEPVFCVSTGVPILLRGTLWPEQPASRLKHRSPPIEGTGMTRLVLVIDPVNSETG